MNTTDINHANYRLQSKYNLCVVWLFVLTLIVGILVLIRIFCKKFFVIPERSIK